MTTAIRGPVFLDSVLEFLIPEKWNPAYEMRRHRLRGKIVKCIETYSEDANLANMSSAVSYLAQGIFSKVVQAATKSATLDHSLSVWSTAKQAMLYDMRVVLSSLYQDYENAEIQTREAEAAIEFLLRYLVDDFRLSQGMPQKYIKKTDWNSEKMGALPVEEIVERAVHGDGTYLPKHTSINLVRLINSEIQKLDSAIDQALNYMKKSVSLDWLQPYGLTWLPEQILLEANLLITDFEKIVVEIKNTHSNPSIRWNSIESLRQDLLAMRLINGTFNEAEKRWVDVFTKPSNNQNRDEHRLIEFAKFGYKQMERAHNRLKESLTWIDGNFMLFSSNGQNKVCDTHALVLDKLRYIEKLHDEYHWIPTATENSGNRAIADLAKAIEMIYEVLRIGRELPVKVNEELKTLIENQKQQIPNLQSFTISSFHPNESVLGQMTSIRPTLQENSLFASNAVFHSVISMRSENYA